MTGDRRVEDKTAADLGSRNRAFNSWCSRHLAWLRFPLAVRPGAD